MKNIIILLLLALVYFAASGQQTTTVKVPPNKDTTVVKFTTTTTTSANTTTTYTTTTTPSDTIGTPTPPPTGGETIPPGFIKAYANNYNTGTTLSSGQCGRCAISTTHFPDGALKAWYQAGDGAISSGFRSEQQLGGSETPNNRDIIMRWDQIFETIPSGTQGLSMQTHGGTNGTSGYGSMWISGGQFMFQFQPGGCSGCANTYQQKQTDGSALERIVAGKKYHWYYEIRWSTGSDGYIRIWLNGKSYYSFKGKTCDGSGGYFKPGINLFNSNNTVKVHIDNLEIWHN